MQSSPVSFHRRSLSEFSGKLPAIVSRPASSFYLHTLWQPHQLRTSPPHRVPFTPAHPLATPSRTLSDLETHGLRFTPRSLWRSSPRSHLDPLHLGTPAAW